MKKKRRAAKEKGFNLLSFFSKEVFIVAGLLLLALILRLIYLSHLKVNDPNFYQPPSGTDMLTYHNYAQQILNGTFGKEPYYYGPLYSYFLALVYKIFGVNPYIASLIQMMLGVATSLLIYFIAKKVFNKTVAFISISISIFYGMFYIYEGVLLMESLVTFLNTLSIFLLLRIENNPSYKNIAFAGIAIGLSALARANILLFVPFILIWIFFNSKLITHNSKLLRFAFLCLVILLTISPATIRNYLVSGRFILISTNGPISFWTGNHPGAPGEYVNATPKPNVGYIEDTLSFIRKDPKGYLNLQKKKFLLFWSEYEIVNNVNHELQKSYSFLFKFPHLSFGPVALLALVGIALSLRKGKRCLLLYLNIFSLMTAIVIVFVTARYRLSILPFLIIFASFSLYWWSKKIREKKIGVILLSILLLVPSWALVYSNSLYVLLHPEGRWIETEEMTIVKDCSDLLWHGEKECLRASQDRLKKEFILPDGIEKYKEVILWLDFTTGPNPGSIFVTVNNGKEIIVSPPPFDKEFPGYASLHFKPDSFCKGRNTIVFGLPCSADIRLSIDRYYTFGRSYVYKEGRWKKLKKGEYMVFIKLISK